jgi:hypothetical protein
MRLQAPPAKARALEKPFSHGRLFDGGDNFVQDAVDGKALFSQQNIRGDIDFQHNGTLVLRQQLPHLGRAADMGRAAGGQPVNRAIRKPAKFRKGIVDDDVRGSNGRSPAGTPFTGQPLEARQRSRRSFSTSRTPMTSFPVLRSDLFFRFVVVVQNFFQVAAFGLEQFGAAGDLAQADFMLGGNFTLGFSFVKILKELPAQGQCIDFTGGKDLLEQDLHITTVMGAGKNIDQFPGSGIHEKLAFKMVGGMPVSSMWRLGKRLAFSRSPRLGKNRPNLFLLAKT